MAAVSGLEGDLVGGRVGGFEPGLQEGAQILHHVLLKGFTRSSNLGPGDENETPNRANTGGSPPASYRQHAEDHARLLLLGGVEVAQDVMNQLVRF